METVRQSTRGIGDATISLTGADAELLLAVLKFVSHLASGEEGDEDTELTAEALNLYHTIGEQVTGSAPGLARWGSASVDALSDLLKADVLAIVHRNYRQSKDGLAER